MDILVKTDTNYANYLKVLMISVYENNKNVIDEEGVTFYCLYDSLDSKSRLDIKEIAERYNQHIEFINIDLKIFDEFPDSTRWPRVVYSALLAHYYLPKELHRILFLDVDIIVNGNLKEFYNLPFDDNYFIGSRVLYNAKNEPKKEFEKFTYVNNVNEELLLDGKVFNSGVLLFNLDKLREDNINIEFYNNKLKNIKKLLADQGVYNYCFYNKIKLLTTCKYNYRISFSLHEYLDAEVRHKKGLDGYKFYHIDAKIIHYCGYIGIKPWRIKLEKNDIPKASKAYLGFVPESVEFNNIWWKYAAMLPETTYNQIKAPAEQNAAIYRMVFLCLNSRPYTFHNVMKIEPLTAPVWDNRNNVNMYSDLNEYIESSVYICDSETKKTIKNIPSDFKEDVSFRLTVKYLTENRPSKDRKVLQILEADDCNATVYRRLSKSNGATWSAWNKLMVSTNERTDDENVTEIIRKQDLLIETLKNQIEENKLAIDNLKNEIAKLTT